MTRNSSYDLTAFSCYGLFPGALADGLHTGVSIKDASMLETIFMKANAVYPMGEHLTLMDDDISVVNIGAIPGKVHSRPPYSVCDPLSKSRLTHGARICGGGNDNR